MRKICVLSKNLANKIAAGEVVERPASVVKELVENAIDAKSTRIFVSLLEGGVRLIQVTDDGEGMIRDEALLAFERHATSKIAETSDLTSIMTLGFRGEALPSMASVSKLRLTTKEAEEAEGTEIDLEGGTLKSIKQVAAPRGSTFGVRDLFFNVPARKKFLKSEQTELSHIRRVLFDLALSHANIHFRLTHGGRILLDALPAPSFKERAEQLLGERIAAESMTVSGEAPTQKGLFLSAFLARPPLKRNYKREQYIFVNHRPIKSPLLTHAVYDAYGSYLMKGEEPFFVLFLTVDPSEVDVNVHPAKREVRFQKTQQIHQAIRNTLREALSKSVKAFFEDSEASLSAKRNVMAPVSHPGPPERTGKWVGWPDASHAGSSDDLSRETKMLPHQNSLVLPSPEGTPAPLHQDLFESAESPFIRPIGQVYGTFLLAEIDGVLVIVDQHTAHERILYEVFLEAWQGLDGTLKEGSLEIQPLLIPQQVDLSVQQGSVLKDHLKALEVIGCKIESFGETAFLVREAPALISSMNFESFLGELADELGELGVSSKIDQPIKKILASMACHGAVRAHQSMSLPEIESLLKKYFNRKTPPTCPHGRPIVMPYPLSDLEKAFRRK